MYKNKGEKYEKAKIDLVEGTVIDSYHDYKYPYHIAIINVN